MWISSFLLMLLQPNAGYARKYPGVRSQESGVRMVQDTSSVCFQQLTNFTQKRSFLSDIIIPEIL